MVYSQYKTPSTFTGKVEESTNGKAEGTKYYYQGQTIASTGGNSGSSYSGGGGTYNLEFAGETTTASPESVTTTKKGGADIRTGELKPSTVGTPDNSVYANIKVGAPGDYSNAPNIGVATSATSLSTTRPYWQIQQENNLAGYIDQGNFAASVNLSPGATGLQTIESYQTDRNAIAERQQQYTKFRAISSEFSANPASFEGKPGVITSKTDEGTSYTLTEEYFNNALSVDRGVIAAQTKQDYANLPYGTKLKLEAGSIMVGGSKFIIGAAETIATIGVASSTQTIESGDTFKPWSLTGGRSFKFSGNFASEIRAYPSMPTTTSFTSSPLTYIKQKAASPQLITEVGASAAMVWQMGGGLKANVAQYGIKGGVAETLGGFGIKPASGIYTPELGENTKFNVISRKTMGEGGTTRIIGGKSTGGEGINVLSTQITKGKYTGSYNVYESPTIKMGGGRIEPGIRYVETKGLLTTDTSGSLNFRAGGLKLSGEPVGSSGTLYSSTISDKYFFGSGMIKNNNLGGVTSTRVAGAATSAEANLVKFRSGTATENIGLTKVGTAKITDRFSDISGSPGRQLTTTSQVNKFGLKTSLNMKPTIKGIEYTTKPTISTSRGGGSMGGSISSSGGAATSLKLSTTSSITSIGTSIPKPVSTTSSTAPILGLSSGTSTRGKFNPRISSVNMFAPSTTTVIKANTKTKPLVAPSVTPQFRRGTGSASATRYDTATLVVPSTATTTLPTPRGRTTQITGNTLNPGASMPPWGLNLNAPTPSVPPIGGFTFGSLPGLSLSSRILGGAKRKTAYIPSYSALVFKERGSYKAGKTSKTGLDYRPINSKFKISRRLKL